MYFPLNCFSWHKLLFIRKKISNKIQLFLGQVTIMAIFKIHFFHRWFFRCRFFHHLETFIDGDFTFKQFFTSLFLVEQKSLLFIFSSATPQRTAYREVPSQMAAHLRTGSPLWLGRLLDSDLNPGLQFYNLVSQPMSHHCSQGATTAPKCPHM